MANGNQAHFTHMELRQDPQSEALLVDFFDADYKNIGTLKFTSLTHFELIGTQNADRDVVNQYYSYFTRFYSESLMGSLFAALHAAHLPIGQAGLVYTAWIEMRSQIPHILGELPDIPALTALIGFQLAIEEAINKS
jgi:hypothetical protein